MTPMDGERPLLGGGLTMKRLLVLTATLALLAASTAFAPGSGAAIGTGSGPGGFDDVVEGSFYEQATIWAAGQDITTGTTSTTFSPDRELTRAEGITLLWRANGAPTDSPDSGFTDVASGVFYEQAVNWAKATGVTIGVTDTEFGPNQPMTRAMYATMIWRAAGSPAGSPDAGFDDVVEGSFYEAAVDWMKAQGITTGIDADNFGPTVTITRAMGVTFLWRDNGSPVFSLNVFHVNDHHSNLAADDIDFDVEAGEVELELGGFPRVVTIMDHLASANAGENNVTVHAGDAITGTLFYTLFDGEADAALMNEVCFDMFALGNHEFDAGDAGLATFLDFLAADADCDTPVLAANIVPQLGTPLFPAAGESKIQPFFVKEFGDEKVAFVGIDIKQKTEVSSQPDDTTVFLDEVTTAQNQINQLTAMGYDKIGLVTHQGYDNDIDLASMVSGVDFIVGGDSHSLLGEFPGLGLTGAGAYPTIASDADGKTTCIVQAWEYSKAVGSLNVQFDDAGDVVSCGGDVYLTLGDVTNFDEDFDDDDPDAVPSPATQADVDALLAAAGQMQWAADADAQATLDGFSADVDELAQEVIGSTTDDLCLARVPYQDEGGDGVAANANATRSGICVPTDLPNGGEIQQQVTDAFLDRAFRGQIALQNSGGVRIDIPAGDITIADAYELLPFANTLIELDMTGEEIVLALEQGVGNWLDSGGSSGAYPYGAGIRWDIDISQPFGSRFTNVEVQPKGTSGWEAIDLDATYVVVANSFMAGGGDGYEVLADVVADGRSVDTFLDYSQSWIDWLEAAGGPVSDPTEFSTVTYLPVPA